MCVYVSRVWVCASVSVGALGGPGCELGHSSREVQVERAGNQIQVHGKYSIAS